MVCVLDFKRDVGLWHGILCVSTVTCTCTLCYRSSSLLMSFGHSPVIEV